MSFVKMSEAEEILAISESTIRRHEKRGLLPTRIINTDGKKVFIGYELEQIITARIQSKTNAELQVLVEQMIKKRMEQKQ